MFDIKFRKNIGITFLLGHQVRSCVKLHKTFVYTLKYYVCIIVCDYVAEQTGHVFALVTDNNHFKLFCVQPNAIYEICNKKLSAHTYSGFFYSTTTHKT